MTNSRFLIEDYAGVTLITFSDHSVLDGSVIQQLGRDLCAVADQHPKPRLVLNFANVRTLSSHMLGILLTLLKHAETQKGGIVLCALRPELKKIFTITSLDKVFKFCADDVEGLKAFGVHVTRGVPDARQPI